MPSDVWRRDPLEGRVCRAFLPAVGHRDATDSVAVLPVADVDLRK